MNSVDTNLTHLPNGELNAPFLLSQANLLLQENDIENALSIFRLLKNHPRYNFCGHYGIGQCFLKARLPEPALQAFQRALTLARRPYIAEALLEAMLAAGDASGVEKCALIFAREFPTDTKAQAAFRRLHQAALSQLIE